VHMSILFPNVIFRVILKAVHGSKKKLFSPRVNSVDSINYEKQLQIRIYGNALFKINVIQN
jgi:hypothetical protein